jgi:hypothetical protein
MKAKQSRPFLAVVDGAEVSPPPAKAARKPRMTPADREATAIAAADTIECLLPAYVELYRAWAKGAVAAGAYRDANTSEADRYKEGGPVEAAVEAIRETTGANAAQRAMNAMSTKLITMARIIEVVPVASPQGLRAKTLAAMWECMPGIAGHIGFDFGDAGPVLEMLFRANIRATGLSELATTLEGRLGKGEA